MPLALSCTQTILQNADAFNQQQELNRKIVATKEWVMNVSLQKEKNMYVNIPVNHKQDTIVVAPADYDQDAPAQDVPAGHEQDAPVDVPADHEQDTSVAELGTTNNIHLCKMYPQTMNKTHM